MALRRSTGIVAECIADIPCVLGENPLWHPDERCLYWTDIEGRKLYRFDPETGASEQCYEGPKVGGFTVETDGSLLLFRESGNIVVWRDGQVRRTIIESVDEIVALNGRFNDVIADPCGRVYCGSLNARADGTLYRLELGGILTPMVTGVGISNGLAFSRDYKTLYHTDSQARSIRAYPYDAASGNIGQGSLWLNLRNAPGEPDGMTMDSDDRIWSARWNGFGIYAYDLSGEEVDFISIPAAKCSSVTFGGDLLDRMFLTSAGGEARRGDADKAGALFMVRGVGRGRAECRSSIASW